MIKLTFSTERLYQLTEGWYRNISLLLVPRTDSLNSLVEALVSLSLSDIYVNVDQSVGDLVYHG